MTEKQKDFSYQELDDEYGSRKCFPTSPSCHGNTGDSSEDLAKSLDEEEVMSQTKQEVEPKQKVGDLQVGPKIRKF